MNKKDYSYRQDDYRRFAHHERRNRFLDSMPHKLVCQYCGGAGGEIEIVTDDGQGPFYACGLCEGTGYLTPHERMLYLRWRKQEKMDAKILLGAGISG